MLLQITLTFLLTLAYVIATPPPGYQKKEETKPETNVPKYNYGYKISDEKGSQEKQEQRDGIYAHGRYYVHGADSHQTVEYLADDWGYHPFIQYSNEGPHSKSSTLIALGEEAVKALHSNQKIAPTFKPEIQQKFQNPGTLQSNVVYVTQPQTPAVPTYTTPQDQVVFLKQELPYTLQPVIIPTQQTTQADQNLIYVTHVDPAKTGNLQESAGKQQFSYESKQSGEDSSHSVKISHPPSKKGKQLEEQKPQEAQTERKAIPQNQKLVLVEHHGQQQNQGQQQNLVLVEHSAQQNQGQQQKLVLVEHPAQQNQGQQQKLVLVEHPAQQNQGQQQKLVLVEHPTQQNQGQQQNLVLVEHQVQHAEQNQGHPQNIVFVNQVQQNQGQQQNLVLVEHHNNQVHQAQQNQGSQQNLVLVEHHENQVQHTQQNHAGEEQKLVLINHQGNQGGQEQKVVIVDQVHNQVLADNQNPGAAEQKLVVVEHHQNQVQHPHQLVINQDEKVDQSALTNHVFQHTSANLARENQVYQNANAADNQIYQNVNTHEDKIHQHTSAKQNDPNINSHEIFIKHEYTQKQSNGQQAQLSEKEVDSHQQLVLIDQHNNQIPQQEKLVLIPQPEVQQPQKLLGSEYVQQGTDGKISDANQYSQLLQQQTPSLNGNQYLPQQQTSDGNQYSHLLLQQTSEGNQFSAQQIADKFVNQAGYINTNQKTINDYKQQDSNTLQNEDDPYPYPGLYGTKINPKLNAQEEHEYSNEYKSSKLIEHTKHLITGQDVLNINDVLNQKAAEVSTASSIVQSTTEKLEKSEDVSLLKEPIVVAELDENNINEEEHEGYFSTTRSTLETANTASNFESTATIVVTPRPVATTFLAPITAGVQLEQSDQKEVQHTKTSVLVDIQKSVPYYIGRFEYVHGPNGYESKQVDITENSTAESEAIGKQLLQYTIEALPTPQALIQHRPIEETKVQSIEENDQKPEQGQVDYQVQAPYQQLLTRQPEKAQVNFQQPEKVQGQEEVNFEVQQQQGQVDYQVQQQQGQVDYQVQQLPQQPAKIQGHEEVNYQAHQQQEQIDYQIQQLPQQPEKIQGHEEVNNQAHQQQGQVDYQIQQLPQQPEKIHAQEEVNYQIQQPQEQVIYQIQPTQKNQAHEQVNYNVQQQGQVDDFQVQQPEKIQVQKEVNYQVEQQGQQSEEIQAQKQSNYQGYTFTQQPLNIKHDQNVVNEFYQHLQHLTPHLSNEQKPYPVPVPQQLYLVPQVEPISYPQQFYQVTLPSYVPQSQHTINLQSNQQIAQNQHEIQNSQQFTQNQNNQQFRQNENQHKIIIQSNQNEGNEQKKSAYEVQESEGNKAQDSQKESSQQIHSNAQNLHEVSSSKENIEQKYVEITKFIEKPYPVKVPVPQPYPVEKIVEKIVHQPYPVEVKVPVEVPVTQTIEKIVEKKVPVPVEVKVPVPQAYVVEVPKPYPVHITKLVPQPYPVTVTHTVKVPVPTPVEVKVPHPVPVEVPKYIDRPYPIYVNKETHQQLSQNPYLYAANYHANCNHKQEAKPDTFSYQPIGSNFYHTIHLNDYIGLTPPRLSTSKPHYQTAASTSQNTFTTSSYKHNTNHHTFTPNHEHHNLHSSHNKNHPEQNLHLKQNHHEQNSHLKQNHHEQTAHLKQNHHEQTSHLNHNHHEQNLHSNQNHHEQTPHNINHHLHNHNQQSHLHQNAQNHVNSHSHQSSHSANGNHYNLNQNSHPAISHHLNQNTQSTKLTPYPHTPSPHNHNINLNYNYNYPRKFRNARHSFEKNLRIEYGFMPPLIPSLEIDENGKPIEKPDDN